MPLCFAVPGGFLCGTLGGLRVMRGQEQAHEFRKDR